jgi:hypothetical protein
MWKLESGSPVDRLNLGAQEVPQEALEIDKQYVWANISVPRALKLFPEPTSKAVKSEVTSLLNNDTFAIVDIGRVGFTLLDLLNARIVQSRQEAARLAPPSAVGVAQTIRSVGNFNLRKEKKPTTFNASLQQWKPLLPSHFKE